jgi:predicted TIM-barrel fold metal-dependent hydrolase
VIVDVHAHVVVGNATAPPSMVYGDTLAAADAAGIDRVIVAPWVRLLDGDVDALNEHMRALRGDRVAVLGAVALDAPELPDDLPGVEIPASVGGDYLGHDRFEPFWAAAEAGGKVVFIHPTTRAFDWPDYYLWNTVGNPFETTITAAHMVMCGVMERHPDLRVLLAHGGGALLALRGRLQYAHGFQPQARSRLRESPEASIRRFYFDTLTHDAELLKALIDFAGADHVLLGSDYPFDMGDPHQADTVRSLGLAQDAEAAILAGNAERMLLT